MIGEALRIDIEAWAAQWRRSRMYAMASEGRLTKAMITRYIANVTYMIRLTAGHLRQAQAKARSLNDDALVHHYEHKLEEEIGHDKWGDDDLEKLATVAPEERDAVSPAMRELGQELTKMIENDPCHYLCYLAFTEYVTALLGPELMSLIEDRNGVPRTSMTVVENHIEIDKDHAEEGWGCIDDLVQDPAKMRPLRDTLARIMTFYDRLAEDLTLPTLAESGEMPALVASTVDASAA